MSTPTIPSSAFPLSWPTGVPRTSRPRRAAFAGYTYGHRLTEVRRQLALMHARSVVISTNLPVRLDGEPMASATVRGGDHGVAVYWAVPMMRGGKRELVAHCMPCDRWDRLEHNLHAIALSLEALRGVERWGAVTVEQAFAGFAALPPGAASEEPPRKTWREVLGIPVGGWTDGAPAEAILAYAKMRHREIIQQHHPDHGGEVSLAAEANVAISEAERELGAP